MTGAKATPDGRSCMWTDNANARLLLDPRSNELASTISEEDAAEFYAH